MGCVTPLIILLVAVGIFFFGALILRVNKDYAAGVLDRGPTIILTVMCAIAIILLSYLGLGIIL